MMDNFEIPDHLRGTYQRMILRSPEKLRENSTFRLLTLLHLKVGGERLASHNTELFKLILDEERIFNRWLIREGGSDENDPSAPDELSAADDPADSDDDEDRTEDNLDEEDDDYEDPDSSDEEFPDDSALQACRGGEGYLSALCVAAERTAW